MNEQEWLDGSDDRRMLAHVMRQGDARKLRLFAVACCWAQAHSLMRTEAALRAVRLAEHYAEEQIGWQRLRPAWVQATAASRYAWVGPSRQAASAAQRNPAYAALDASTGMLPDRRCALLREVWGNPFRRHGPAAAWAGWNDATAARLARRIEKQRAFELMPILADALEEAGCTDPALIDHCRRPGRHVRGCWAIDLLLGKG